MKVIVNVSLKEGVLDPEGQAIKSSLNNLGFEHCSDVRTGKQIILNLDQNSETEVLKQAKKMCEELLVNTVIENYEIRAKTCRSIYPLSSERQGIGEKTNPRLCYGL